MGIGAACAHAFGRRGARLALVARSAEALAQVCAAVAPADALALAADLRRPEQIAAATGQVLARWGRIDVLVNNAGVGLYQPSWKSDPAQLREMMEVNFFAPVELIRQVTPAMRQQGGGVIVNVSSIAGKVSLPWLTLYSASKAALNFLSDGLRMELQQAGIRVVAVCPGYVSTGFPDHVLGGRIPGAVLNRKNFTITPEQCAAAIVKGVEQEKRTVVTPAAGWLLIGAARLFPRAVDRALTRMRGPEPE